MKCEKCDKERGLRMYHGKLLCKKHRDELPTVQCQAQKRNGDRCTIQTLDGLCPGHQGWARYEWVSCPNCGRREVLPAATDCRVCRFLGGVASKRTREEKAFRKGAEKLGLDPDGDVHDQITRRGLENSEDDV